MTTDERIASLKQRLQVSKNVIKAEEDLQNWIKLDLAELTCPVKVGDILKDTADPNITAEVKIVEPAPHDDVHWRMKLQIIINGRKHKALRYYYSMAGWKLHRKLVQ